MGLTPDIFRKVYDRFMQIPGSPHQLGDNSIMELYVKERCDIKTTEQLLNFTTRWLPLYTLPCSREAIEYCPEEIEINSGTYNPKMVMQCLNKSDRDSYCEHVASDTSCAAQFILVPIILLLAKEYSEEFKVPVNAALFQMCAASMV